MTRNRTRFSKIFIVAPVLLLLFVAQLSAASRGRYNVIHSIASGTGSYMATTGYYFGPGNESNLGDLFYNGTLDLTPIGDPANGLFEFKNRGRDTPDEIFHEVIYTDGSTISSRSEGTVQLIPEFDSNGDPTGLFTAQWSGIWTITKGSGKYLGAKGFFEVSAINDPFNPNTDPVWHFSWSWEGTIYVPKHRFYKPCISLATTTSGRGVFDPANLGLGDPSLGFPVIIGDGSGAGIYDGTPTGHNFRIRGHLVGNGYDRHFGTAQSISPGIFIPTAGMFRYPGVSGDNPDGSGRNIHIMKTWLGQIWFEYKYYFELDPAAGAAGVITGNADFRIVGGTWFFRRAGGSVYVKVVSDLTEFDPGDPSQGIPPSAPFDYQFTGYIQYCLFRR